MARFIPVPVAVGVYAALLAFPQTAAADTTLTPLPGAPTRVVYVEYPAVLGLQQCMVGMKGAACGLNRFYPVPDWVDSCHPSFPFRATHVEVSVDGELDYSCGGNGFGLNADPAWFQELDSGATYQAKGWSIVPTAEGITFTNNETGHGMTFTLAGANAF